MRLTRGVLLVAFFCTFCFQSVMAQYTFEKITFLSRGTGVVGNLLVPNTEGRKPAVVIIGPVAYVKEQSPIQYATRMAKAGYVTLIFDPRYHGESPGEPRRWESRQAKVEDLRAAVDYLAAHASVDAGRIYGLGVCQGVNWMIEATSQDARIRRLAIVAGHYLMPETARMYLGSPQEVDRRLTRAKTAKVHYEQTGQVDYIPIAGDGDPNALLLNKPIYEWYIRWADRGPFWNFHGQWENRITAMSEADIWGYRVDQTVQNLHTPTMMIHADHAASGPNIPKKLFEAIPALDKKLVWLGDQVQFQFYEYPLAIDRVSEQVAGWFNH